MKQIIFILIFTISINSVNAQFIDNNSIYLAPEGSLFDFFGESVSLNYVYKKRLSFKIGYSENSRKSKSKPEEFTGTGNLPIIKLGYPFDEIKNYQIAAGRIFELNKKGTIRINLALGIGYSKVTEPKNWVKITGNWRDYDKQYWEYHKYNTVSFSLNPKIEFPFSRFYGLTLSPILYISKSKTYVVIEAGHMLGLLRKKKTKELKESEINQ